MADPPVRSTGNKKDLFPLEYYTKTVYRWDVNDEPRKPNTDSKTGKILIENDNTENETLLSFIFLY